MTARARPVPPRFALTTPDERGGAAIPAAGRRFQSVNGLGRGFQMRSGQRAPNDDPLNGLGHPHLAVGQVY